MGISDLKLHKFRYKHFSDADLMCPICNSSKEDEIHFVLVCRALSDIREKYIRPKYYRNPCMFKLSLLLASANATDVRNCSIYLYKAFKYRESFAL